MFVDWVKKNRFDLILFASGVFFCTTFFLDTDFGWHYMYGKFFLENGRILRENIFSYTFPDYNWANSYWLSQIIIAVVYDVAGALGLSVFFSILFSFAYTFFVRRIKAEFFFKYMASIILFFKLSSLLITVRPMFFGSLFLLIMIYILLYEEKRTKYLPLLFFVWANMHADFVLGLFILFVFAVVGIYKMLRERDFEKSSVRRYIKIPLVSAFITLINPYGIYLWETLLIKETSPLNTRVIREWLPIATDLPIEYMLVILFISIIFVAAYITKRSKLWYLVVMGIFALLSINSAYFFRPYLLLGIFPLIESLSFAAMRVREKIDYAPSLFIKLLSYTLVAMVFLLYLSVTSFGIEKHFLGWGGIHRDKLPVYAVEFIKDKGLSGNMFNKYSWGGYLIWKLPEHKTFIDGRMPAWSQGGESIFSDYLALINYPSENLEILDKYEVNWVLMEIGEPLTDQLMEYGWQTLYEDDVAVILVKQVR